MTLLLLLYAKPRPWSDCHFGSFNPLTQLEFSTGLTRYHDKTRQRHPNSVTVRVLLDSWTKETRTLGLDQPSDNQLLKTVRIPNPVLLHLLK